ncbi:hypothetical protein T12_3711 [Trichinella patagoniensis]|uniref:Uncharacterized protein n=1 Tax=Trichinella patagoniensis TaxID=990121 RepID=A0A0V0Z6F2_9BILA|nr:hypothetical protein T12_3711 [Trichinella patagoniensis]
MEEKGDYFYTAPNLLIYRTYTALFNSTISQAEAPPIDTEGTLRNIDWLEADQTRKAEVRVRSENKRLTLTIMTRFADVNKKEQKGATHSDVSKDLISRLLLIECKCYCRYSYRVRKRRSPREDGSCLISVYSVDTAWENRNHKNLIRLIRSVSVERKRLIFNTDVEVVWIGTIRSNT